MKTSQLGKLAQANAFHEKIPVVDEPSEQMHRFLRMMYLIRRAEEKIGDKVTDGTIKCPCHLGIGQEAIAVGISENLRKTDRVFGGHRSHAHFLAQGASLFELFAEVLGKQTGCSAGLGGSMHLTSPENGFAASVPIVAGTIGFAVGAALASQKDKKGDIAVAYFGDGATEEGTFHECLNFAAVFSLPVLFVCENNLFSSHLHIDLRQPSDSTARFAEAHLINNTVVDGNNPIAVRDQTEKLVKQMRAGGGPAYLEVVTYRWRGHVGPREDIDVGVKRKDDLALWKGRDPIRRLSDGMKDAQMISKEGEQNVFSTVDELVEKTWQEAESAPYPPVTDLTANTFKEMIQ